jgi:hypothetical protein
MPLRLKKQNSKFSTIKAVLGLGSVFNIDPQERFLSLMNRTQQTWSQILHCLAP